MSENNTPSQKQDSPAKEVESNVLLAQIVKGLMRDRSTLISQRRDLDGNKLWRGRDEQWAILTREIQSIDDRVSEVGRWQVPPTKHPVKGVNCDINGKPFYI